MPWKNENAYSTIYFLYNISCNSGIILHKSTIWSILVPGFINIDQYANNDGDQKEKVNKTKKKY